MPALPERFAGSRVVQQVGYFFGTKTQQAAFFGVVHQLTAPVVAAPGAMLAGGIGHQVVFQQCSDKGRFALVAVIKTQRQVVPDLACRGEIVRRVKQQCRLSQQVVDLAVFVWPAAANCRSTRCGAYRVQITL